jgi:hypothetical protein
MGSTSTLEVVELSEQESLNFSCEIVWKKVHTNETIRECQEPATHLALIHCNANDAGRGHPDLSKYVCTSCLTKVSTQMCGMHDTKVLLGYTTL